MGKLPLSASVVEAAITATVSSAAGGAGAAINDTRKSYQVFIKNNSVQPVEFTIDNGTTWVALEEHSDSTLDLDLSVGTIKTRKHAEATANGEVALIISSMQGGFAAGEEEGDVNVVAINEQTGTSYTLVLEDGGDQVDMNNGSANTCNIPTHAVVPFPIGTQIWVCMKGAGVTTIAGAGVTLQKPAAKSLSISAQYEKALLHKVATNTWRVNAS